MKYYIIVILFAAFAWSCDYLEPELEKQLTMEETFAKRTTTERYLAHVYSFMPRDFWAIDYEGRTITNTVARSDESYFSWTASYLAYPIYNNGSWNPTTDAYHTWTLYYQGINQATVFINHVDECADLSTTDRANMKAEARFLRAYYYDQLVTQYGPVYVWDEGDPDIALPTGDVDRHSLDRCVNYIIAEYDAAAAVLPETVSNNWYGRATKGAVLAAKSAFLIYMARPLFNGCEWYRGMKNYYGDYLFPQTPDPDKWETAAQAAKAVIDMGLYSLYENTTETDPFKRGIKSYQGIFFEKWNRELIFAIRETAGFEWCVRAAPLVVEGISQGYGGYAPSLKLVDTYPMAASGRFPVTGYTNDGKDPVIDPKAGYTGSGFTTGWLHPIPEHPTVGPAIKAHNSCVGRDARFYASILFQGMNWISSFNGVKNITFHSGSSLDPYNGGTSGYNKTGNNDPNKVGFLFRRMNNPVNNNETNQWGDFSWPVFRLAEIYLNYAEACNEKPNRDEAEGLKYWNMVRARSGLNKIEEAYPEIKGNKELYQTLLRKERMVELAFEGHRYHDIRTWMIAEKESHGKRYGLNLLATTFDESWERTDAICTPIVCEPKHHLFPIHQDQLDQMKNITQNYGW